MSVLANVTTKRGPAPPRVIIYGPGGVGKTTWATQSPQPIVLPTEDGLGNLDVPALPLMTDWSQMHQALLALINEQHDYRTVVIDSLDHLEPLIWKHVCDMGGKTSIEDFGYGKGYTEAASVWRQFFALLTDLRTRGIACVCVAHHEVKVFNDPSREPYDRYQIKMHRAASALAIEWADAVLFANYQVVVDDTGNRARGIGSGERTLYTEERPSHVAKNRYGLPYELPMAWAEFQNNL